MIRKHKDIETAQKSVCDPGSGTGSVFEHESVREENIPSTSSWPSSGKHPQILALFKIQMDQDIDHFRMDQKQYSAYSESESEILIQDAIKFQIIDIRQINYKEQ